MILSVFSGFHVKEDGGGKSSHQPCPSVLAPIQDMSPERTPWESSNKEGRMPAYWVARSRIIDPIDYKKYTDLVPDIIARHGGKVLARGGRFQIMEGPHQFHRFVVIEFPTFEAGIGCFASAEYDRAAAFRRAGAGEVETVIVDGCEPRRP
jgi:uncharacterized protein (DUF1330 family)